MGSGTGCQNGGQYLFKGFVEPFRQAGRFARDLAAGIAARGVSATEWRRRRLLILGYHGIALEDEHLWDGTVYMPPDLFRRRLSILQKTKCAVLPLGTALHRLYEGTLPPRAVTLVFDDGFHDFARVAAPLLAEFGYMATVYVSSYYAEFNRPIFDSMLNYLLWKGSDQSISLSEVFAGQVRLDERGRRDVGTRVHAAAFDGILSGRDKDRLLAKIAHALDIDYEHLCRKRLLHMMNAREVRHMKALGHDIQMHTHRHRVSRKREWFAREIHDNRRWIEGEIGGARPVHLSFPGGVWQPVAREWLTELGVQSATTCRPALADPNCDRLRLPRFIDHAHVRECAFRGWVAGSMSFLPKREEVETQGQILEETINMNGLETRVHAARA
jgi:peptidoglycan/xylan/chitin deacetylase (PgdA/CDA1 family)